MIIKADSRHIPLQDKSVNCIITSPPYWSLRKYDIPDLIWDGDENCKHDFEMELKKWHSDRGDGPRKEVFDDSFQVNGTEHGFCSKCGAWTGQLGLEPTIDLYLKHLLQIMDECKRVLRDDGTMWVNLGDSYAGSWGNYGSREGGQRELKEDRFDRLGVTPQDFLPGTVNCGIPPKSLCLIPERFAIEMVSRGWILRNKIIWHKPNCMPSSAKDRFTVDFEPVFFFVKSKKYWFEQQYEAHLNPLDDVRRITKQRTTYKEKGIHAVAEFPNTKTEEEILVRAQQGRNMRSVWTIPTQPYKESHFSVFPEALVKPMIKAGCPQYVCKKCGVGKNRIYKKHVSFQSGSGKAGNPPKGKWEGKEQQISGDYDIRMGPVINKEEIGYTDCGCNAGFDPGVVLDPFSGSGTTLKVAERLGRKAIGLDLGYHELQKKRLQGNQIFLPM